MRQKSEAMKDRHSVDPEGLSVQPGNSMLLFHCKYKMHLHKAQKTLPPLPHLNKFVVGLTLELLILIFLQSEWSPCKIEFILLRLNGHIHLTTLTITYKALYFHRNHGNIYCTVPQHMDYPSPLSETIPKEINFSNSMDGH